MSVLEMFFTAHAEKPVEKKSARQNAKSEVYSGQEILNAFGRGLAGTQILHVEGSGTPLENGAELLSVYTQAKALTPDTGSRITVLLNPGSYELSSDLSFDGDNINVMAISAGSSKGVYIKGADIIFSGDNVHVHGIDTGTQRFKVEAGLTGFSASFCDGGNYSFGGYTSLETPASVNFNGDFFKCTGGNFSFGTNNTFDNANYSSCTGGNYSFGSGSISTGNHENCVAQGGAFGGYNSNDSSAGTAAGVYRNCTAFSDSFGGGSGSTATGEFVMCKAGNTSFGSDAASFSGTAHYCVSLTGSFNTPGGTITFSSVNGAAI